MRKLIEKSVNAMAFTDWFKFAVLLGVVTISQISRIHEQIIKMKTRVCLLQLYNHCPNSSIAAVKVKLMKELFCKHFQSFLKFQKLIKISRMKSYRYNYHTESIRSKLICSRWFLKIVGFYFYHDIFSTFEGKKSIMNQISQRMSVSTSQT